MASSKRPYEQDVLNPNRSKRRNHGPRSGHHLPKGDRHKLNGGPASDRCHDLCSVADRIIGLYNGSYAIENSLRSSRLMNKPNVVATSKSLNRSFDDVQALMESSAKQLRATADMLEKGVSSALLQIAGEKNWWRSIDIFTSSMSPCRVYLYAEINITNCYRHPRRDIATNVRHICTHRSPRLRQTHTVHARRYIQEEGLDRH